MSDRSGTKLSRVSDLDLRLIRVFKAVVESGGFTAAVPALGISRSAVSLHMAELETRVGVRLCQRGRAGFALTAEGKEMHAAVKRLLVAVDTFRSDVNALHDELRGDLTIGITDNLVSLPQMTVSHALAALKKRGTDVRINIEMRGSGEVETGVLDGHFHVGVVPKVCQLGALVYRRLYAETAYLYAATTHPLLAAKDSSVTDADITEADAVQPNYRLSEAAKSCHEVLKATATASGREGIAFLILTGSFIGFLPEHFARRWTDTDQLVAIRPEVWCYTIDYELITRRSQPPNRVLTTFLDEIRENQSGEVSYPIT